MPKTEKELQDVILAWIVRRKILLTQDAIDDLAREIIRLGPFAQTKETINGQT